MCEEEGKQKKVVEDKQSTYSETEKMFFSKS
jgi:hypothetical protein